MRCGPRGPAPCVDHAGRRTSDDAVLGPFASLLFRDVARVDDEVQRVLRDRGRLQEDGVHLHAVLAAGPLLGFLDLFHRGPAGQGHGDVRRAGAEVTAVLPDGHGLGAAGDAVQRGEIAVLAADRGGAFHALGGKRRDDAAGHAVVLRQDRVHLVVGGGEDLFHVALRVLGLPAVGEGFADDGDLARVDLVADDFHHAFEQEGGVRIARIALDDGVVAVGLHAHDGFRDDPAHALVVEGQVEGAVILDQAVVADHGDILGRGGVDGGADRVLVHGEDDERVGALGDQRLDIRQLLGRGGLGVGGDVGGAGGFEGLLDGGLVRLPALFLEVRPAHADGRAVLGEHGGGGECGRGKGRGEQRASLHGILPGNSSRTRLDRADGMMTSLVLVSNLLFAI